MTNVPSDDGDRVGAAVVCDTAATTVEALRGVARSLLSSFKVPTVWLLLDSDDDIPRGATGKVEPAAARTAYRGNRIGGQPMKTKGALVWDFNQPWSIEEIEIGDPRRGEVKVQLEAAGLCHSDHHLLTGDIPMAAFPILGGHEGAGVVTEIGPGGRGSGGR